MWWNSKWGWSVVFTERMNSGHWELDLCHVFCCCIYDSGNGWSGVRTAKDEYKFNWDLEKTWTGKMGHTHFLPPPPHSPSASLPPASSSLHYPIYFMVWNTYLKEPKLSLQMEPKNAFSPLVVSRLPHEGTTRDWQTAKSKRSWVLAYKEMVVTSER